MSIDIDAALAELGLTRADLPGAVLDTVAAHLEDHEPGLDALLRSERGGDAGFAGLFGRPDRAVDLATPDPDPDDAADRQVVAHIFGRPDPDGDNAA